MDKRIKWGIIVVIGAGVIALGIHTFTPGKNEELEAAEKQVPTGKSKALNVNAKILKPHWRPRCHWPKTVCSVRMPCCNVMQ